MGALTFWKFLTIAVLVNDVIKHNGVSMATERFATPTSDVTVEAPPTENERIGPFRSISFQRGPFRSPQRRSGGEEGAFTSPKNREESLLRRPVEETPQNDGLEEKEGLLDRPTIGQELPPDAVEEASETSVFGSRVNRIWRPGRRRKIMNPAVRRAISERKKSLKREEDTPKRPENEFEEVIKLSGISSDKKLDDTKSKLGPPRRLPPNFGKSRDTPEAVEEKGDPPDLGGSPRRRVPPSRATRLNQRAKNKLFPPRRKTGVMTKIRPLSVRRRLRTKVPVTTTTPSTTTSTSTTTTTTTTEKPTQSPSFSDDGVATELDEIYYDQVDVNYPSYDELHDPAPPRARYTTTTPRTRIHHRTNVKRVELQPIPVNRRPRPSRKKSRIPKSRTQKNKPKFPPSFQPPKPVHINPVPKPVHTITDEAGLHHANAPQIPQFRVVKTSVEKTPKILIKSDHEETPNTKINLVQPQAKPTLEKPSKQDQLASTDSPQYDYDYDYLYDYIEKEQKLKPDDADTRDPNIFDKFSYGYKVDEKESGNFQSRNEEREGGKVTGSYEVALPDGRIQSVKYVADEQGFRADVTYKGETKPPATTPPTTSPLSIANLPRRPLRSRGRSRVNPLTRTGNLLPQVSSLPETEIPNSIVNTLTTTIPTPTTFEGSTNAHMTPWPAVRKHSSRTRVVPQRSNVPFAKVHPETFGLEHVTPAPSPIQPVIHLRPELSLRNVPQSDFSTGHVPLGQVSSGHVPIGHVPLGQIPLEPLPLEPVSKRQFKQRPRDRKSKKRPEPTPKPLPPPVHRSIARVPPNPFLRRRNRQRTTHKPVKPQPKKVLNRPSGGQVFHPLLKPGLFNRSVAVGRNLLKSFPRGLAGSRHPLHPANRITLPLKDSRIPVPVIPRQNHQIPNVGFINTTPTPLIPQVSQGFGTPEEQSLINNRGRVRFTHTEDQRQVRPQRNRFITPGRRVVLPQNGQTGHRFINPKEQILPHDGQTDHRFINLIEQAIPQDGQAGHRFFTPDRQPVLIPQIGQPIRPRFSPPQAFPFTRNNAIPQSPTRQRQKHGRLDFSRDVPVTTPSPNPFKLIIGKPEHISRIRPSSHPSLSNTPNTLPPSIPDTTTRTPPRLNIPSISKAEIPPNHFNRNEFSTPQPTFQITPVGHVDVLKTATPPSPTLHITPVPPVVRFRNNNPTTQLPPPVTFNSNVTPVPLNRIFPITSDPFRGVFPVTRQPPILRQPFTTVRTAQHNQPQQQSFGRGIFPVTINPFTQNFVGQPTPAPLFFNFPSGRGSPSPTLVYNPNKTVFLRALGKTHAIPLLLPVSASENSEVLERKTRQGKTDSVIPRNTRSDNDQPSLKLVKSDIYPELALTNKKKRQLSSERTNTE